MNPAPDISVNFDPASLRALNIVLGIVMFGVAIDMRLADFARIAAAGKAVAIGFAAQFFLLPAFTWLLVSLANPSPGVALGMILVAACPGGNMSNFVSHHARGDAALSVTMTSASTVAALLMTPLNLSFWGGFHEPSRQLLRVVQLDPMDMAQTLLLILGVPLALGMTLAARRPGFVARMRRPMRAFSLFAFALLVVVAVAGNWRAFLPHLAGIAWLVALHNAGGLALGYWAARLAGLGESDRRSISIEIGMQNSGLGLVLVFNYFGGNGGMAIVAAWWGVWHIVSGLALATWWRRREPVS